MNWQLLIANHKKLLIGLALIGAFAFYHSSQKSSKPGALDSSSQSPQQEIAQAQQDLLREKYPEALSITKGDRNALQSFLKSRFGLKLKEIKQNPDGTFDAVLSGGDPVTFKTAPILSKEQEAEFKTQFMQLENKGREVQITERDRKEISDFRRSVLGL